MSNTNTRGDDKVSHASPSQSPRVVRAEELFHGAKEIWIEHAGRRYRLRVTRRNKLILQK